MDEKKRSLTGQGEGAVQQKNNNAFPSNNKNTIKLTPRHQRIHAALAEVAPEGILSFDLRDKCGCMNIGDEVMAMRRQGFNITCELEPFVTVDGVKSKIGRYRLVSQEGQI